MLDTQRVERSRPCKRVVLQAWVVWHRRRGQGRGTMGSVYTYRTHGLEGVQHGTYFSKHRETGQTGLLWIRAREVIVTEGVLIRLQLRKERWAQGETALPSGLPVQE
jgi:hypothetical protein